jgi:ABC-type transport system substrate-binding protein
MNRFALTGLVCAMLVFMSACSDKNTKAMSDSFYYSISAEPTTLNPLTSTDASASVVQAYVIESLLSRSPETYGWEPSLAEKWEISSDKKVFTFTLRENVMWTDGQPFTAEDVKFSFDAIFDPELNTAHMRPYYESIEKVEIVDPRTVKFYVKDSYFKNFDVASTMQIIPKHFYSNKDKKKEHNKVLVGTGPYQIDSYDKGKRIVFKRNEAWWGRSVPTKSKEWNFKKIVLRFISEENVTLESLKKGDLDYVALRGESYMKKTEGPEWGTKLHKIKTVNKSPKGYSFIGWNLKHPILSDKKVRQALSLLYNRPLAMEKFEFNLSAYADGPIEPSSDFHSNKLKAAEFNPQKALEILKSAGWSDSDGDGVLDKVIDGKKTKFSITILEPLADFVKYLTIYKEEAKKVGIELDIKQIEWNSFVKLLDERKFDSVRLAWSAGSGDPDLKQIWHSASQNGGSNFINYSNKKVDQLIDQARGIHEREKRIKVYQTISEMISADDPYLFLFAGKNTMYAHSDRVFKETDTMPYSIGMQFWTFKP